MAKGHDQRRTPEDQFDYLQGQIRLLTSICAFLITRAFPDNASRNQVVSDIREAFSKIQTATDFTVGEDDTFKLLKIFLNLKL